MKVITSRQESRLAGYSRSSSDPPFSNGSGTVSSSEFELHSAMHFSMPMIRFPSRSVCHAADKDREASLPQDAWGPI